MRIEKSTNGDDANEAPGPEIAVGGPVRWTYTVMNTGIVPLSAIRVVDDRGEAVTCPATTLAPDATLECSAPGVARLGPYRNVGTVTPSWTREAFAGILTASDASHYLGIDPDAETGPKVQLCHKTGTDRYVEVSVSLDAEPAYRAHGDSRIGEAVPGQTGRTFGTGCRVQ